LIPPPFIQRPRPNAGAFRPTVQARVAPAPARPYDPESDPNVRSNVTAAYSMRMKEIQRNSLGMSANHGVQYRKQETSKLLKKLADESKLDVEQIKRIITAFEQSKKMPNRR
jgi:hypothetical protein